MIDWSLTDRRFLRSLRVKAGEPPPPSKRFVVEPGIVDGEFHVVDRQKRFRDYILGSGFQDARSAAEEYARQMNDTHG